MSRQLLINLRRRLHNSSGQPMPVLHHLHSKVHPDVQDEPSAFQESTCINWNTEMFTLKQIRNYLLWRWQSTGVSFNGDIQDPSWYFPVLSTIKNLLQQCSWTWLSPEFPSSPCDSVIGIITLLLRNLKVHVKMGESNFFPLNVELVNISRHSGFITAHTAR